MADRRFSVSDWLFGTNINNSNTGNKDAAIQHVAMDDGLGAILGTAANPLNVTDAGTGGDASAANQTTQITAANLTNTEIGSLTETAPATDTASSGLNGRLQRIAQRLTTIITSGLKIVGMNGVGAGNPTYRATVTGYGGYATPTDLINIAGSASKTVIVTGITLQIQSTAAALQTLYFIKRSTANTGGTPTSLTAIPLDSTNAAATAVLSTYAAAPTLGSAVGNVLILQAASVVATAAPAGAGLNNLVATSVSASDLRQGVVLRGVAESLSVNYNGGALTVGLAITAIIEWIEV